MDTRATHVGLLQTIIDPLGRVGSRQEYNAQGRLVAIVSEDGKRIEMDVDIDNSVQTLKDAKGRITTHVFDGMGNVVSTTNAAGVTTRSQYDSRGNQTLTIDALGNRTEYAYDANDQLTRITNAIGASTFYSYNAASQITKVVDALGNVSTSEYDGKGNTRVLSGPSGSRTEFSGENGQRPTEMDISGKGVVSYEYDAAGRIIRQNASNGLIVEYVYDGVGNLLSTTQRSEVEGREFSNQLRNAYDNEGRWFRVPMIKAT